MKYYITLFVCVLSGNLRAQYREELLEELRHKEIVDVPYWNREQIKWKVDSVLELMNLDEKTMIIITSDHGERFDHITEKSQFGTHGHTLYDSVLNVPLIIGGPEEFERGKTIKTQSAGADLLPTILDYLGIDYDSYFFRGKSLLPLLDKSSHEDREVYSSNILGGKSDLESLRTLENKLIRRFDLKSGSEVAVQINRRGKKETINYRFR